LLWMGWGLGRKVAFSICPKHFFQTTVKMIEIPSMSVDILSKAGNQEDNTSLIRNSQTYL
jgi:hypothetical protein